MARFDMGAQVDRPLRLGVLGQIYRAPQGLRIEAGGFGAMRAASAPSFGGTYMVEFPTISIQLERLAVSAPSVGSWKGAADAGTRKLSSHTATGARDANDIVPGMAAREQPPRASAIRVVVLPADEASCGIRARIAAHAPGAIALPGAHALAEGSRDPAFLSRISVGLGSNPNVAARGRHRRRPGLDGADRRTDRRSRDADCRRM